MDAAYYGNVKSKTINLEKPVEIYYGIDIVKFFSKKISEYDFDKLFLICDSDIYDIHGLNFFEQLKSDNIPVCLHILEPGEVNKNIRGLEKLCNSLIEEKISKDSIIIGFGGGVTGNMSGLAAALIYRGIRYVEVPTTFMGMTDSSLSNKQAVNGGSGKNQLGTYYAPLFVWSDIRYAETEKKKHIKASVTEGIKNALIYDKKDIDFYRNLDISSEDTDVFKLYELFRRITDSKNAILAQDPTEKGYAVILEYGHTFGHAIEYLTDGQIIHGEAVASGMCIAAEISHKLGYLSEVEKELHYELLFNNFYYNLHDYEIAALITPGKVLSQIKNDNKRSNAGVKYVLLKTLGECLNPDGDFQVSVDDDIVLECIRLYYANVKMMREEGYVYFSV